MGLGHHGLPLAISFLHPHSTIWVSLYMVARVCIRPVDLLPSISSVPSVPPRVKEVDKSKEIRGFESVLVGRRWDARGPFSRTEGRLVGRKEIYFFHLNFISKNKKQEFCVLVGRKELSFRPT